MPSVKEQVGGRECWHYHALPVVGGDLPSDLKINSPITEMLIRFTVISISTSQLPQQLLAGRALTFVEVLSSPLLPCISHQLYAAV